MEKRGRMSKNRRNVKKKINNSKISYQKVM